MELDNRKETDIRRKIEQKIDQNWFLRNKSINFSSYTYIYIYIAEIHFHKHTIMCAHTHVCFSNIYYVNIFFNKEK